MIKSANASGNWELFDCMRGISTSNAYTLRPNSDQIESDYAGGSLTLNPNGFSVNVDFGVSGREYIYMAIRRPNKPAEEFEPEELFSPTAGDDNSIPGFIHGFVTDMAWWKAPDSAFETNISSRLHQGSELQTHESWAERASPHAVFDYMDGWWDRSKAESSWGFRRAPGFFDVVAYEGDGQAGREVPHSLGVAPEMMWIKVRDRSNPWPVYNKDLGNNAVLYLNTNAKVDTSDRWYYTTPTESVFTLHSDVDVNRGSSPYIAYLFASVPGICDIGTYTGNGATQEIDCGFTTGVRFVLIKRTDAAGDWMYFDTLRGISSNASPMLKLNTTDAQESIHGVRQGYMGRGFDAINGATTSISGAEYIYMAIA
jgi:hypothetical protein